MSHRYQPRRHSAPPIWAVALLAFGVFAWLSPFALIVGLVHFVCVPDGAPDDRDCDWRHDCALVIIIALRERRAGRPS